MTKHDKSKSAFGPTGKGPENIPGSASPHFLLPDSAFEIVDWHPQLDGRGKPEQVHLLFRVGFWEGAPTFVLRLKTKKGFEDFVAALKEHADRVWPVD